MIKFDLEDLHNLSLEDIAQWPEPLKWFAVGLVFFLVVSLGYTLDTRSQMKRRSIARNQEAQLKEKFKMTYQHLLKLRKLREHVLLAEKVLGKTLAQLPREVNIQEFLDDVSKLGAHSQVEFRLLKPLAPNVHKFYVAVPVQIEVFGDYHQLAHFVSAIANSAHLVSFGGFVIRRRMKNVQGSEALTSTDTVSDSSPVLELSVVVELFHYENESVKLSQAKKG